MWIINGSNITTQNYLNDSVADFVKTSLKPQVLLEHDTALYKMNAESKSDQEVDPKLFNRNRSRIYIQ